MYIIICWIDRQSRFDAWDRVLRAGALGWPWGMGWGGRWEGGSRWGSHVPPWLTHVNVWQKTPQYCKVISLQLKKKKKRKKRNVLRQIFPLLPFYLMTYRYFNLVRLSSNTCALEVLISCSTFFCIMFKVNITHIDGNLT